MFSFFILLSPKYLIVNFVSSVLYFIPNFLAAIRLLIQQWNGVWVIVLRDIKQEFAHTILGPIWFIIQPLIQSVVFYFVFGEVGRMPTEGKSSFFFYIFGILIWTSFSQISLNNSWTMIHNRGVITKIKTSPFLFP